MHYREALRRVTHEQWVNFGGFYQDLPDLHEISLSEALEVLTTRFYEMDGIIKRNEVSAVEVIRFLDEYFVICLLLVICIFATIEEEIPISEPQMEQIKIYISNSVHFATDDDMVSVIDVAREIVKTGLESKRLTSANRALLESFVQQP